METSHAQYKNNTRDFFFKKIRRIKKINKKMINTYTVEDKIYLKCSY